MNAIWPLLWQILTFKKGPEDLPFTPRLMMALMSLDLAVSIGAQTPSPDPRMIIIIPLIALAVDLAALRLLLAFKGASYRFVQAGSAIFGGDLLLTLLNLPIILGSLYLAPLPPVMAVLGLLQMVLLGWGLGFRALVYHRTMNIGLFQANILALTLFLLTMTLTVQAFPELLAEAQARAQAASSRH